MGQSIIVTGMVISTMPISDYDKRIVILTKERGKITAFARGARRPNSTLLAATNPFAFGEFEVYEGKSSYNIGKATIHNYFRELTLDVDAAYMGFYFLEFADYYCQENNDEKEMLKLLYQSLRALCHKGLDNRLVRYIFEIKALTVNGEYPGLPEKRNYQESTVYAVSFIVNSTIEKLYTFTVKDSVLLELKEIADEFRHKFMDRKMKSLEILNEITEIPC